MIFQSILSVSKITNFSEFYSSASKYRTPYFLTYMSIKKKTEAEGGLKFAVVTSKKGVHKRAVKRNRARRRIKCAFMKYLKTATFPFGIEIQVLFMANRSVLDATWDDLLEFMNVAMQKVLSRCTEVLEDKI
jgi:ribonuclease P protein component